MWTSGAEVMFAMISAHGNAGNLAGELHRLGASMGLWKRQANMGAVLGWELLWVSINLADHRVY